MPIYVATLEVASKMKLDRDDELDRVLEALGDWHVSIGQAPRRGHYSVTITLPAESLRAAVATAIALVEPALAGQAVGCEVLDEAEHDARQGWQAVPDLVSVAETAQLLGVSRQAVLQRITSGSLPATRVGRSYMLARAAVEAAPKA